VKRSRQCKETPWQGLSRIKRESGKKLEDEEKEFLLKKREYERKMIDMEKQEVFRREQEIEEKNTEFQELKRKNKLVQEKVEDQIKTLQMKLKEMKTEHQMSEDSTQTEIDSLNDTLGEVQISLKERMDAFGEEREIDLLPTAPDPADLQRSSHLYPSLQSIPSGNRSWHQIYSATSTRSIFYDVETSEVSNKKDDAGSLGSSPQISLGSNESSTRTNPESDSDSSV